MQSAAAMAYMYDDVKEEAIYTSVLVVVPECQSLCVERAKSSVDVPLGMSHHVKKPKRKEEKRSQRESNP